MLNTNGLTDEQRACAEAAYRFAMEQLAPRYRQQENAGFLDPVLIHRMGALGLIGADLPATHGGIGLDSLSAGVIIEAIGHADLNMAYVPLLASLNGGVLARFAAPEIAKAWLPRVVAGEAILAIALTEPGGGSDAAALSMRAERCSDGYRLRGEKTSISMVTQALGAIVFARTGTQAEGARGVSGFFVPLDLPGIARTAFDDLGSRAVGRGSIFFDDVLIPQDHLLGEEGRGFGQIMQGFDYSRALIGLQCLGAAQASLNETWSYIQQRQAFGKPLSSFQGVTFPLAECDAQVEAVRQLCLQTLRLRDQGLPHTREAAMSKWLGPKTAFDVIHQCLLSHGHYGYSLDLPHQQRLRDVMGLEIGDGTAQIMKMIVTRIRAAGGLKR